MSKITKENTAVYLKAALQALADNSGELHAKELLAEVEKRVVLSVFEKSLNNSGVRRWVTNFKFYSIGLVKAGLIEKKGGIWYLQKAAYDCLHLPADVLFTIVIDAYEKWNASRVKGENENADVVEENDEPLVLMDVKPDDISFQDLISGIKSCRIQIPPFQRSFVWRRSDIRYLLDSIYRGYPIGSFIFWRTSRKLPRSRTVGEIELDSSGVTDGTEISYVLDGQQRITSLFATIMGAKIEGEPYRFLFDLRQKKFTVSANEYTDSEEAKTFDVEQEQIAIPLLFLESKAEYNRLVQRYPDEYQDILHNLHDRFNGYRFSVIQVIDKNDTSGDQDGEGVRQVVRMFSRINETGRKLTVVAKMVARCWGEDFDLRESLDQLTAKHPSLQKIREETILQTASVILNHRKCRTREILEKTNIQKLESEWEAISNSLLLAINFVENKLHIKKVEFLPFEALLVPLSYLFYKQRQLSAAQAIVVEQWFWQVSLSNRYDATLESKIEEDCLFMDSVLTNESGAPNYFIDWSNLRAKLISQDYSLRNAFSKTVLALLSYAEPKNITDGQSVNLEGAVIGFYKHNFHHIFPTAHLRRSEPEHRDVFNSLMNIMFIPAITNQSISDSDPATYMKELSKNSEFQKILSHHYIPDLTTSGLLENAFLQFLDYRASQIVTAFKIRTGITSATEEEFVSNPTRPIDILESRMRSLLHEKLKEQAEGSYWENFIPQDIQAVADKRVADELRRHPYKIDELTRDDVRMTFLDIMDYNKIILSNWDIFGGLFGSKSELEKHLMAFKNYRNLVKHSRELNEIDKRNGEAAVLWLEQIL